jgi:hypothetical protein
MIRTGDLVYRTPSGYVDESYVYVLDTSSIANGTDQLNLTVQLQGDSDFILRKVDGLGAIVGPSILAPFGKWWLKDEHVHETASSPLYVDNNRIESHAVIPERRYPSAGVITIDLYSTSQGVYTYPLGEGSTNTPASQLAFWGVKRKAGVMGTSSKKYRMMPWEYHLPLTVNWDEFIYDGVGNILSVNTPQTFVIPVTDWDFELWGINDTGDANNPVSLKAKIQLYDANDKSRFSQPLLMDMISANSQYQATLPQLALGSAFSPPIVYPISSLIKIDVYSMLLTSSLLSTQTRELVFFGGRRMPV